MINNDTLQLSTVADVRNTMPMLEVTYMPDSRLAELAHKETFTFDVECYSQLFYVAFKHKTSGEVVEFEISDYLQNFNADKLIWMLKRFKLESFNGNKYDIPMLAAALCGLTHGQLKALSDEIIIEQINPWALEKKYSHKENSGRRYNLDWFKMVDHIDLIEVCPLSASLKIYAGRLHGKRLQDLPYQPDEFIDYDAAQYIKNYCSNDLTATELISDNLRVQQDLRVAMSEQYKVDLRSKSDAQIAEAVIGGELRKITGKWPDKGVFVEGGYVTYKLPNFIDFTTPELRDIARQLGAARFPLSDSGNPSWPTGLGQQVKNSKGLDAWSMCVKIGQTVYRMGMGGLHSSEKTIAHVANKNTIIADHDVESYYPRIIINQRLAPKHLGANFLTVFETIVDRRVAAKRMGDKSTADSLKIVINGTFGKLGSRYSIFYSPDLLAQVTISGQLSLLMLIERLENVGINVISANTDGIVLKFDKSMIGVRDEIIKQWEADCNYVTEETRYLGLYSRDVNNYVALTQQFDTKEGWLPTIKGAKTKGAFNNPWGSPKPDAFRFHKNPEVTITIEAMQAYLISGTPIEQTIRQCNDVRKFLTLQAVRGGCHKDGVYLGNAVRWYYSTNTLTPIFRKNGNMVPMSIGAMPIQDLPDMLPDDIDYKWYILKTEDMLRDIGCTFEHAPTSVF